MEGDGSMNGIYAVLFLAVVVAVVVIGSALIGCVCAWSPANIDITEENMAALHTYTAPDGRLILAYTDLFYAVQGNELLHGCYHLTAPAAGEAYGTAEKVWFTCPQ